MASDASDTLDGYAIRRNNSCATSETDCGGTWGNFRRCCPGKTQCPRSADHDSGICCPTWEDCSNSLINNAHCADKTANLYYVEISKGYVCCSNDTVGFHLKDNGWVGCAKDLKTAGSNTRTVVPVTTAASTATASNTATTTTTSLSGTTSASTSTTTVGDKDSHSTNTGAIAGGVVGGVLGAAILLGLVWWLLRRRKTHQQGNQSPSGPLRELGDHNGTFIGELPESSQIAGGLPELNGERRPAPAELPSELSVEVRK